MIKVPTPDETSEPHWPIYISVDFSIQQIGVQVMLKLSFSFWGQSVAPPGFFVV